MMKNLLDIAEKVYDDPHRSKARLLIARNDYMIEKTEKGLIPYQVEFNLIASGMGPINEQVQKVHQILNLRTKKADYLADQRLNTTEELTKGLIAAHNFYGVKNAIIVVINKSTDKNIFDQMFPVNGLMEQNIDY